ncbi:hypothetical protein Ahy_A04g019569 isoform B [Arachis hypogaea]|uniref:Tropinone reductase n=1 Tax=Arachis hypogaea TaxID=3818 RepID=A0A445DG79_ARAHY|nr:hypothetical protein Ahy_A04g019569 isoform B [Arachis hypogaea]
MMLTGAVNQLTKNLALEWAKDNIRVNSVAPGNVQTKLLNDILENIGEGEKIASAMTSQTPLQRMGEPKEISSLVVFLCLSAASFITGQTINADGGFTI